MIRGFIEPDKPVEMNKRAFHAVVKQIRDELNRRRDRPSDYPKPVLGAKQMQLKTATINCGGQWTDSEEVAAHVSSHPALLEFLGRLPGAQLLLNPRGPEPKIRIKWR